MSDSKWSFDKSVSVSNLLTTMGMVAGAIAAYYSLSERVTLIEREILSLVHYQLEIDEAQDESLQRFRETVREDTKSIQDKLDMLIERAIDQ